MNRFAKMKKERIYTLFETLSFYSKIRHEKGTVAKKAHVKSKVDLLFSAVSARFFSGENLCNSK